MSEAFRDLRYRDRRSGREKLARLAWEAAWLLLFRPTPRWALHGWRRGLLRLFGARLGEGSRISPSCFVWAPWNLEMGSYSVLGDQVDCYSVDRIVIGSKVAVSQRAFLCTATHDTRSLTRPLLTRPIRIGDHVWIAAEAMVLPGVVIHEGAVIGARSLVAGDAPAWTISCGNPCRPRRERRIDPAGKP